MVIHLSLGCPSLECTDMGPGSQEASFSQEGPRQQKPLSKASCLAVHLEARDLLQGTGTVDGLHPPLPSCFMRVTMKIAATLQVL